MCTWATIFSFLQGLCSWAINIIGFYEVYCDVEPKRKALAAANAELAAAQEKLAKIKAKIQVCMEYLFSMRICSFKLIYLSKLQDGHPTYSWNRNF